MNNNIFKVLFAAIVLFTIGACKKNNLVVDKEVVPPSFAKFNSTTFTSTYYVSSNNTPFKIPVGITAVADKDRTVTFTYASSTGAAQGTQYTAPTSLVIPAGKALDSLTIQGIYAGYPSSSKIDTLKVTIASGDVAASAYNNVYTVIMRKYCDVDGANLVGDYANSTDTYNGGASSKPNYTATISNWTPLTPTSASVVIKNLGATSDNGWGPFDVTDGAITPGLTATLDWSNPANFSVTIPQQNYFGSGSAISTITATGTFSSCDNTFNIVAKVKYAGNGSTYTHTSIFRR
jgi:hypothetical protein